MKKETKSNSQEVGRENLVYILFYDMISSYLLPHRTLQNTSSYSMYARAWATCYTKLFFLSLSYMDCALPFGAWKWAPKLATSDRKTDLVTSPIKILKTPLWSRNNKCFTPFDKKSIPQAVSCEGFKDTWPTSPQAGVRFVHAPSVISFWRSTVGKKHFTKLCWSVWYFYSSITLLIQW